MYVQGNVISIICQVLTTSTEDVDIHVIIMQFELLLFSEYTRSIND